MYASIVHVFFLIALAISTLGAVIPHEPKAIEVLDKRITVSGTHSGDGTYYEVGLGACGKTDEDTELVAAVSHTLFDDYPGYSGVNPNDNPVCGRKIKATYKGKSVTVNVVDRCVGCGEWDLDLSPTAFSKLAAKSVGRISGVQWEFE